MNESEPHPILDQIRTLWRSPEVVYFPIRHHSPACATFVRRWIAVHRPVSVLVEGPASFTSMIPHLIHAECVCPVAIYTYFIDKQDRLGREPDALHGPARFAAFYPLCDYSPEMVALREGHAVGANLRFIDLEHAESTLIRQHGEAKHKSDPNRPILIGDDPHLAHSDYIHALIHRFGCRDFNELWDHVFESAIDSSEDQFVGRLLAYCALARHDYSPEQLRGDATEAREACMAAAISQELAANRTAGRTGPVLVVTGGFHTIALPALVAARVSRPKEPTFSAGEVQSYLIRYSFDQLDSLNGYASGMPCPAFYDRLWTADSNAISRRHVVADWLVEIVQHTRDNGFAAPLSTADAIAALENTRRLADLRGHPWPMREDMLDGIRSSFVKGEIDVEGRLLMAMVRQELAGTRIGKTPEGAAVPPIVDDFRREGRRLRLPVEQVERREMALDLYRNADHRRISQLFHRLDLLNAPFAAFVSGPDFVTGTGLERMQEVWRVCWSPATEGALIEASVRGPTVEEAALHRLVELIDVLEEEGRGRSAASAVDFLVRACRLGLHRQVDFLIPLIDAHLADDPAFASVVQALSQIDLLQQAREPLEAMDLPETSTLGQLAYRRACKLLDDLCGCPDEQVDENLKGLRILRDVVVSRDRSAQTADWDQSLFLNGLRRIVEYPFEKCQPVLTGAAAGIMFGEGQLTDAELMHIIAGYLGGSGGSRKTAGILRGLLATARELAWQVKELLQALDNQFGTWDQDAFLAALPDLRLAFADLTPREIVQVADRVAELHGESTLGDLIAAHLEETEVALGLQLSNRVRGLLKRDGLQENGA